jgi:ubiquinone/menaquinone biosynthesis C-methylase UbiE
MSDVDQSSDAWRAVAAAWDEYRDRLFELTRPVSDRLVEAIDPQPGQTVLELAAGPGETGFLVAERVGEAGRVISSDLDGFMLDAARRGADARGLRNVEIRKIDAQEIELADRSIDAVLCRFGIMLLPDPAKAVAGVHRVLRPGGRFAYAVFGPPAENPWMSLVAVALVQSGHPPQFDPGSAGSPFSLADVDVNRALLEDAGFSSVTADALAGVGTYRDFDEYWEMQSRLSGPLAMYIASLDAAQVAEVRAALRALAEPFISQSGVSFPSNVVIAAGTS